MCVQWLGSKQVTSVYEVQIRFCSIQLAQSKVKLNNHTKLDTVAAIVGLLSFCILKQQFCC